MGHLPEGGLLVWDKRTESGKAFMSEAEAAWVNRKGKVRMFSHCWQGFSRASENSQHFHPTQKPVAVLAWCLGEALLKGKASMLGAASGAVAGVLLSASLGLAPGPVIVMLLGLCFLAAWIFSPRYGVIASRRR
jgi:hypothetical protein